jgi:subtilase family serine protease
MPAGQPFDRLNAIVCSGRRAARRARGRLHDDETVDIMRLKPRRPLRALAFFVAVAVPLAGGVAYAANTPRVALNGSVPSWTRQAKPVGKPDPKQRISVSVVLSLRDPGGAEAFAAQVSDPTNAAYGHYLTPAQFNARFAPTAGQVSRVRSFLTSAGLSVTGVADGNRWVTVSGTTRQLQKAFATTLRTYSWHGKNLRAPESSVSIPSALRADIAGVTGLDETATLRRPDSRRITPAKAAGPNATPDATISNQCSQYWDQFELSVPSAYGRTTFPTYGCGYTAPQIRGAYGVQSLLAAGQNGQGVTVAIIDAYGSSTMLRDLQSYAGTFDNQPVNPSQYSETLFTPFNSQTGCGGETGWNEEEALDVEAVHAMAPGANIHYIGAQNCGAGLDDALNYVVQNHVADLVSNSWGSTGEPLSAADVSLEHSIFVQAAAEGIGFYFSSGDDGDNVAAGNTVTPQPDYPASDPQVTAVGGTSLGISAQNGYLFETAWGSSLDISTGSAYAESLPGHFVGGAGGGTSTIFGQPAYQQGAVPDALANRNGTRMRVVPDVSAVADPYTGFRILVTLSGSTTTGDIGGTSLACPLLVGFQAVVSQGRATSIGFANPLLYRLKFAYHDVLSTATPVAVTSPSASYLLTFDRDSSLKAALGYDNVTGLGSPNGSVFWQQEKFGPTNIIGRTPPQPGRSPIPRRS